MQVLEVGKVREDTKKTTVWYLNCYLILVQLQFYAFGVAPTPP